MGIDQFPSPFKVKPLIKKQKLETSVQSEIDTPPKSEVIENSKTITNIEPDNRLEDLLSWIDDLDSRMKRTLSRQYLESIELKNQTNMEDLREKYRQVPFDDSFRKLSSILRRGNEDYSGDQDSYGVLEGKIPKDDEDAEMDFKDHVETKESPEPGSEEELEDDIIEIISSEKEDALDSENISNDYEENEEDEEGNEDEDEIEDEDENEEDEKENSGLTVESLRTQGVAYHIRNGRPRLLDQYMNINNNEQSEKSEYSSEYSDRNDSAIDEMNDKEDEHDNEDEYEQEHGEKTSEDARDNEIIILDSDEENNNSQVTKEKSFESVSNPASFNSDEQLENETHDNLDNEVDDDVNQGENEDENDNEHQEYVHPNNSSENNSSVSLVYSNQVEPMNESKVIDEKNLFQGDNLMGLAEAVLKESNEMTDENSFMTARDSDVLYQDGLPQYSTNINSGYAADYDSTDINYQAGNLSGIEEGKEITGPISHMHESFLKEDSGSNDSIQLVDDFENISEGSLADEERDYEYSSNNDKGTTLNKHEVCEQPGSKEGNSEDNSSIEVEHVNYVPIFKTVIEEDPETVLLKLKETEKKFDIRLNSIKCLEDEIILKNGHLPESYISNEFVKEDKNDKNNSKIIREEVVDYGSIPKPIPKPLLQDLSALDDTTILGTMNDGDDNEESICSPALNQQDGDKTFIEETTIMHDNDPSVADNASERILGQIEQSQNTSVSDIGESKHEVLDSIDDNPSEIKDSISIVSHKVKQNDPEGDENHVGEPFLDQMNDIIMNKMKAKEHIDVPALELIDVDQSRNCDTTMNEMEIEVNEDRTNSILEKTESSQSNFNDKICDQRDKDKRSINTPSFEKVDVDQSGIDDITMNETMEENHESVHAPTLEQVDDQSGVDDTTMNETVEENHESVHAPTLEQVDDRSGIDDTTMNETVEENHESVHAPTLEQVDDQSGINDTTVDETAEENHESVHAPTLEQIDADQSGVDGTTMNETVEENHESVHAPTLEQVDDRSGINDTTLDEVAEENHEQVRVPTLEQVSADQSEVADATVNETVEENHESVRAPILEQVDADQSRVEDTTVNETVEENHESVHAPTLEQIDSSQSEVADTTIIEMEVELDDDEELPNSPNSGVAEHGKSSLITNETQKMDDNFVSQFSENTHEESISEMLYPSITQELDEIHKEIDESKIDTNSTNAGSETLNQHNNTKCKSYIKEEENTFDQIPINIDEKDNDLNENVEFDDSDGYENKQSFSSKQIVEEPKETDENIVLEYEQTTYVNIMGDGILHPSYIMEPSEEQDETPPPNYSEQLEVITETSTIDDMEVLEPSAIIEPSDTIPDRVELINSAFEQQYEIIEPTDVLEPPSRSQTPNLFGIHRGSINAEEIFDEGSSEKSRKRSRESEGFVGSKLRKLISKPFKWLSKNRNTSRVIPSHIEAPKLRPLDDTTSKPSFDKVTLKPFKEDADIKADGSVSSNKKKYYELMHYLKKSVESKSNDFETNKPYNMLSHDKGSNSDDSIVADEDKPDYNATNKNELNINDTAKVEEKNSDENPEDQNLEDQNLEDETLNVNDDNLKHSRNNATTDSDDSHPFTQLEINDTAKKLNSTKQRSTSTKSRRPRKVLGLDMSEAHIEPVRSLRSGHKYGPEENDHVQTSDLLSSPKKTSRSSKELPELRINKRRHLSNTKAFDNTSPIEIDSKQSLPSSRKSSGSKWVESLLDHPALRTRSKSPLKRSIYQISSELEEDFNLPRRSRRLRHNNEKLNDNVAYEDENTEAEEIKRGRPTKRH